MTEQEAFEEAILLLWEKEGHSRSEPISGPERQRLIATIEDRRSAIEQETQKMLISRLSEGRRYPRRHMFFAFKIIFGAAVVAGIVLAIYSATRR